MKITIVVDTFPVKSQTFVLNQVTGLMDLGVDVGIVSLYQGDVDLYQDTAYLDYDLAARTKVLINRQSGSFTKLAYRLFTMLYGVIGKQRKKVVAGLLPKYGRMASTLLLSSIAAKQSKTIVSDYFVCHFGHNGVLASYLRDIGVLKGKIATVFHGFDISDHAALALYKNDYQQLFQHTELMLPISDLWKAKLLALGCPTTKIKVHRMGVDLNIFTVIKAEQNIEQPRNFAVTAPFMLFTVARFSTKKGIEYVLRALALLPENINIHYNLGGFGELEAQLKALVVTLSLQKKVTFLGALDQQQVKKYMLKADAFIQPSITAENGDMEGVPVAIMEAMALGTPVISTSHSGIPELITHGEHGLLAQERDSQGLADCIAAIYKSSVLADNLASNARAQIEKIADVNSLNQVLIEKLADN